VVGLRIVVRRLVPGETGPSGGPAMTDVLGVCVSWSSDSCVVQPSSGPAMTIALADIVSGKPVPPRPPVRLRIQPDEAQRRAMALFPDLETAPLGAWTLRHSPTQSACRAGSVLAMTDPGVDPAQAHDRVVAFYAERRRRPVAAVLRGTPEEALFVRRGWGPESPDADTVFALSGVAAARRRLPRVPETSGGEGPEVELVEQDGLATLRIGGPSGPVASGVVVVDGDWAGFRSISVEPGHRRRGLAVAVMATLLEWCAEQGARTAYLQVLGDNAPAQGLYEGMGFVEHHRYRYLAASSGS